MSFRAYDENKEGGVPYVQATHNKKGRVNFDEAYFVTPEWAEWQSKAALQPHDVLIVQTGAGTGDVGLVSDEEIDYTGTLALLHRILCVSLSLPRETQVVLCRTGGTQGVKPPTCRKHCQFAGFLPPTQKAVVPTLIVDVLKTFQHRRQPLLPVLAASLPQRVTI